MFSITKLSSKQQELINFLSLSNRARKLSTSIAIGKAIADMALLPSGPLADDKFSTPRDFFRTTYELNAKAKLSMLNELVLIDINTIINYAYAFYTARYNTLYPNKAIYTFNPDVAILDLLGVTKSVDLTTIEEIKKNASDIIYIYNDIKDLFAALGDN